MNKGLETLQRDGFALMPTPVVRQAEQLIEAATRAHTHDGYTGHAALCDSLSAVIRDLCQQLATLRGDDVLVQAGCHHQTMPLGDTECIVEFEAERESGDGFEEPHEPAYVNVLRAYINGAWVSAGHLDVITVAKWEKDLLSRMLAAPRRRAVAA